MPTIIRYFCIFCISANACKRSPETQRNHGPMAWVKLYFSIISCSKRVNPKNCPTGWHWPIVIWCNLPLDSFSNLVEVTWDTILSCLTNPWLKKCWKIQSFSDLLPLSCCPVSDGDVLQKSDFDMSYCLVSDWNVLQKSFMSFMTFLWKMLLLETLRACLQLCLINYLINWTPSTKICVCLSGLFLLSKQAMCFRLRGKHDRKAIHYAPVLKLCCNVLQLLTLGCVH